MFFFLFLLFIYSFSKEILKGLDAVKCTSVLAHLEKGLNTKVESWALVKLTEAEAGGLMGFIYCSNIFSNKAYRLMCVNLWLF